MQHLAVELIEMTDFFLLGMVLYVVAIGMYELFIDPNIDVPDWMRVSSLDDLKTQIVNVVIVMLVVTFLGVALATKEGGLDFLYFGLAIAVVVIAVSFFNWVHHRVARQALASELTVLPAPVLPARLSGWDRCCGTLISSLPKRPPAPA